MKILILGAGQVGYSLAETLVSEKNDITVIEIAPEKVKALQDACDLRAIAGNASSPRLLKAAGAEDTDLMVAATQSDETNLVACKICSVLFNVPIRIARIAGSEYLSPELTGPNGFNVTHTIYPEEVVSAHIVRLVDVPEALQVLDFANNKVTMVAVRAEQNGPLVDHMVKELHSRTQIPSSVVAIYRHGHLFIPQPDMIINAGDEVLLLAASKDIRRVAGEMRQMDKPVKRIMITGGGNIGLRLAKALEEDHEIKIIDHNKERCEKLISQLNNALVLEGDATDSDLLESENAAEMDMFIATTNDDEINIMSALLAKRIGAKRVIAVINHKVYADLIQGGHVDIAVSPANIIMGSLLAYVRRGDVVTVHYLRYGSSEALEIVAHGDEKTSKIIGKKISDIAWPKGSSVMAVVRGENVYISEPDLVIEAEDHVILLITNRQLIQKVEALFEVGFRFF